jgi:hypothetical protein
MDVGMESKASKNYRKNSEKNHFNSSVSSFSLLLPFRGRGVREANGRRLTAEINKQPAKN